MDTDNKTENQELPPVGNLTALVTIVGRPSAGKSTFLNTASGEPVSIVSDIPQTTRNSIRGIVNTSYGQLVFVDTPGLHNSEKKLNLKFKDIAISQMREADAVLYILDSTREPGEEEEMITDLLQGYTQKMVIAVNKSDSPASRTDRIIHFLKEKMPGVPKERILTMSAKDDVGINEVLKALYGLAKESPHLYPPDEFYTDQEVDFRIAEVIRGEAINNLEEEIPHAVYVDISDMEWRKNGKELWVRAFLCVERESQKGIVIGKGASMIKKIRVAALKSLNKIFEYRINLDLQVKVDKNWRQKDKIISRYN